MAHERTAAERLWLFGGVVVVALVAVAGWFLVVSPELDKASSTHDSASSAQDANLLTQQRVDHLRQQAGEMSALTSQLNAAYTALPPTADLDEFTRQLSTYAQDSRVRLTSITVSGPTATSATGPASGPASGGTSASTGAPADTAVVGQTYSFDVSVVSSGAASDQQTFLQRVQRGARAALVTSAALAPPGGSSVAQPANSSTSTLTIELQVYVEPKSPQDQADLQKLLDAAAPR